MSSTKPRAALELRDYQRRSIAWLHKRDRGILAHPPGLGKTACAIMAAELPHLVICPASLIPNWRREVLMWRPEALGQFEFKSYADREFLALGKPGPEARDRLDAFAGAFNGVTLDEVHYAKSVESQRTRAACGLMARVADAGGKVVAMSGTIVPNRPIELWPLLYSLGLIDLGYDEYARRYCAAYENEWGALDVRGSSHTGELRRLLEPHVLRYAKADVLPELPPRQWKVVALDLPLDRQEKRFNLNDLQRMPEPIAFEAVSDVLKLQGLRKVDKAHRYIRDLLESEEKVIVFAHHREVIEKLVTKLERIDYQTTEPGVHPVVIHGGVSAKRAQRAVDAFQDPDSPTRVIVGNLTAMGVGHTLTAASHVVFAEGSWVPAVLEQALDRAHRIGQEADSVMGHLLTIDRSVDEHMLRRALEKQKVIDRVVPESTYW